MYFDDHAVEMRVVEFEFWCEELLYTVFYDQAWCRRGTQTNQCIACVYVVVMRRAGFKNNSETMNLLSSDT
jgi:hypothetical protein